MRKIKQSELQKLSLQGQVCLLVLNRKAQMDAMKKLNEAAEILDKRVLISLEEGDELRHKSIEDCKSSCMNALSEIQLNFLTLSNFHMTYDEIINAPGMLRNMEIALEHEVERIDILEKTL